MTVPRLAYAVDGLDNAPVLILASSLGTTRDMWAPQIDALTPHFRVVRFDHPGHGESPVWDEPVTIAGIGRAVIELIDTLGFTIVSFCGISLGGAVGQWLAARAPERIDRLILCSTAAKFGTPETYLQRAALVREQGMGPVAPTVVQRWFTPEFREQQPETVARILAMLESARPEGFAACCEAVAGFDGRVDLGAIAAPTLIIAGADDPATTVEMAQAMSEGIAGARLEVISHASHLLNIEQVGAVNAAILNHLNEGRNG